MTVLILEDEAIAAKELSNLLAKADESATVLATLDSVEQAIQWLSANEQPDLILSDIQLSDGLSFDIFKRVPIKSIIIFCTAFDEYLMAAFDTNAIGYILKPVTANNLKKALAKYNTLSRAFAKEGIAGSLTGLLNQLKNNYKTTLLVYYKTKIIPLPVASVAFFYLDKTTVQVTTVAKQKYQVSSSLDDLEAMLDPKSFFRANRQFIINKAAIEDVEKFFARKLILKLIVDAPETLIISKANASQFLNWLQA